MQIRRSWVSGYQAELEDVCPRKVGIRSFLAAAVIKFRGPAVGVAGDALCHLQGSSVLQKICDASGSKRMRGVVHPEPGRLERSLYRACGVEPAHRALPK